MSYTGQAPPLTSKEIESMFKESSTARICTHNKDGTIHAIPVSYLYINGQIVIGSIASSRKTRNIEHNENVTVLIDNEKGQGILIYGKAKVEYNNVYQTALSVWEKAYQAARAHGHKTSRHKVKEFKSLHSRREGQGLEALWHLEHR